MPEIELWSHCTGVHKMQCPGARCVLKFRGAESLASRTPLLVGNHNGSAVNKCCRCFVCRHCETNQRFCGEGENGDLVLRSILTLSRKVGQTRRNLQQLVEDIIEELTELQKLCQDGQGRLNNIDPDSTRSLQKLHSSV